MSRRSKQLSGLLRAVGARRRRVRWRRRHAASETTERPRRPPAEPRRRRPRSPPRSRREEPTEEPSESRPRSRRGADRGVRGRNPRPTTIVAAFDANGDGTVTIGVAAAGPRDDNGYYQSLVNFAEEFSAENGFAPPIVSDNIGPAEAAQSLSDLAQQGVDIMMVGASEIAEPLPDLTEQFPDIFWYCNCGAGFQELPGLAQATDWGAAIHYTAGVAMGAVLQEQGSTSAVFLGCCDINFEVEAYEATLYGLQSVDPSFTMEYVGTGDFEFDFDNSANATAALDQRPGEWCHARVRLPRRRARPRRPARLGRGHRRVRRRTRRRVRSRDPVDRRRRLRRRRVRVAGAAPHHRR